MNAQYLPLLCDPDTHAPLELAGDSLLNRETGVFCVGAVNRLMFSFATCFGESAIA